MDEKGPKEPSFPADTDEWDSDDYEIAGEIQAGDYGTSDAGEDD